MLFQVLNNARHFCVFYWLCVVLARSAIFYSICSFVNGIPVNVVNQCAVQYHMEPSLANAQLSDCVEDGLSERERGFL